MTKKKRESLLLSRFFHLDINLIMPKIIGLDISSSNIGYSVIEYNNLDIKLIDSGVIKPLKDSNILLRLKKTKEDILSLLSKHNPDDIIIEDILLFLKNKSNARTIITLAIFNRVIGLACFEYLNKPPVLMSVATIRKFIKIDEKPKKEDIPNLIEKHLNIKFPWILNKKKNIDKSSYDMSDAIAVSLAYIFKQSRK